MLTVIITAKHCADIFFNYEEACNVITDSVVVRWLDAKEPGLQYELVDF